MYRGRLLSRAVHLPCDSSVPGSVKPSTRSRLEVITWNVDGLSDILYAEIKHWLNSTCTADILMFQETHWNFTREWSESGWNFCHSSSGRRGSGGVLVAVRESSFPAALVKWQEVAPGHMLHLRGECGLQQVDVLCVYQHALTLKDQNESGVMKKRALLWKQLDKWLGSMPIRSELIIAGDFNLTLKPFMKVCGHGIPDREYPSQIQEEQIALLDCLRRHKLCVANTWGRRREAHTYRHPTGNTQIDYVITHQSLSDAQTKRSSPFRTTRSGWVAQGRTYTCEMLATGEVDSLESASTTGTSFHTFGYAGHWTGSQHGDDHFAALGCETGVPARPTQTPDAGSPNCCP